MKKFKEFLLKYGTTITALALVIGFFSSNSACYVFFHQPKVPESMKLSKKA